MKTAIQKTLHLNIDKRSWDKLISPVPSLSGVDRSVRCLAFLRTRTLHVDYPSAACLISSGPQGASSTHVHIPQFVSHKGHEKTPYLHLFLDRLCVFLECPRRRESFCQVWGSTWKFHKHITHSPCNYGAELILINDLHVSLNSNCRLQKWQWPKMTASCMLEMKWAMFMSMT